MKQKINFSARNLTKRLMAFLLILAMLVGLVSVSPAALAAQAEEPAVALTAQAEESAVAKSYTYTVDIFRYDKNNLPILTDIANDVKIDTTDTVYASGFYRLTFTDTRERIEIRATNSMSGAGPFADGRFVLTPEYSHAYLVGGASSTNAIDTNNPSYPPIIYYVSATDEDKIKFTAIKAQNDRPINPFYYATGTGDVTCPSSTGAVSISDDSVKTLIPSATTNSTAGLYVFSTESTDSFEPGTNIAFYVRTRYGSDTSNSYSLFSSGTGITAANGAKNAWFCMPFDKDGDGEKLYTYRIDFFGSRTGATVPSADPTLRDLERGIPLNATITNDSDNGFKRIEFQSPYKKVTVQMSGTGYSGTGAFSNVVALTPSYSHAYFVTGRTATFYMSATDDRKLMITTLRNNSNTNNVLFFYDHPTIEGEGVRAEAGGSGVSLPSGSPLLPLGSSASGIRMATAESTDVFSSGAVIQFATRGNFDGSAAETYFSNATDAGSGAGNIAAVRRAQFIVPGAETPEIETQPQDARVRKDSNCELSVAASISDGGRLSYQWYSNTSNSNSDGTLIDNADQSVYAPLTDTVGTTYYYVIVTNTNDSLNALKTASVTSAAAEVEVVETYTVSVSTTEGGSVTGDIPVAENDTEEMIFGEGDTVNLTAVEADNYEFLGWFEDDNLVSSDQSYEFSVSENRDLEAKFQVLPGSVFSIDVTDCVATPRNAEKDTPITVTIDTDNYRFVKWESSDYPAINNSTDYPLTFNMPERSVQVKAVVERIYPLTLKVDKDGVTVKTTVLGKYAEGDKVTLSEPNISEIENCRFITWAHNGGSLLESEYTMPAMAATINAQFKKIYSISLDGASSDKSQAVTGEEVTVTADDVSGRNFQKWTATGITLSEIQETRNPVTFAMPSNNVTLTPVYEKIEYTYTLQLYTTTVGSAPTNTPTLRDIERSATITPTSNTTSSSRGVRTIVFKSEYDKVTVQLSGSGYGNTVWGAFNAANNKLVVLTPEYNNVYLVSDIAETYYMSATKDGRMKLTTIRKNNGEIRYFYWNPAIQRDITMPYGGEPTTVSAELTPSGTNANNLFQAILVSPEIIPAGTSIPFKVRTQNPGSSAVTVFGIGSDDTSTSADKHARFTMPAYEFPCEITGLIMNPGADEKQRNFAWLSSVEGDGTLTVWKDGQENEPMVFTSVARRDEETLKERPGFYSNRATATDLEPGSTYHYRVSNGTLSDRWARSEAYTFKTDASTDEFSFLFAGDPQIGRNSTFSDGAAGWQNTLSNATAAWPNISLIVSGGDQVNDADNELEYDSFMNPDQLRTIPFASTVGNHDIVDYAKNSTARSFNYSAHFNPANLMDMPDYWGGGHYWYNYGDVLFMNLNVAVIQSLTNNGYDVDRAKTFMQNAIEGYKAGNEGKEPKWKIVVMHHGMYSVGNHRKSEEARLLRGVLSPVITELGVDAVLNGHDHSYARSYMLSGSGIQINGTVGSNVISEGYNEDFTEYTKRKDSGDTVYFTANSSSGSGSQYETRINDLDYSYVRKENQQYRTEIVKVDVKGDSLVFSNYYSDTAITESNLIDRFTLNKIDPEQDNKAIQDAKNKLEAAAPALIIDNENVTDTNAAKEAVEALLAELLGEDINITVTTAGFTSPKTGTADNENGTDGSCTFTVTLEKGVGDPLQVGPLTIAIKATPYDPTIAQQDNADIEHAKETLEAAISTLIVDNENVTDANAAKEAVEALLAELLGEDVNVTVTTDGFTEPVAGTADNVNGTDGSYTFTVTLEKGMGNPQQVGPLTITIKATPYNPIIVNVTVTFHANGGTGNMDPQELKSGEVQKLNSNAFAKTNHTFAGWAESATGQKVYTNEQSVTLTESIALFALWTPDTYNIRYNLNGGNLPVDTETSYIYGSGFSLPVPTRTGYTFDGWYVNSGLTGTKVTAITDTDNGNKEYWAKWSANKYTVRFNKTASKASGNGYTQTFTYGTAQKIIANKFKLKGYIFMGWTTTQTNAQNGKVAYKANASLTTFSTGGATNLFAVWGKATAPKRVSLPKVTNKKKGQLIISYKKPKGTVDGYIVYISTDKKFTKKKTDSKTMKNSKPKNMKIIKVKNKKLKVGTTYYIRIKAYRLDSAGKKVLGKISKTRKITVKK